jgi:hypothetical protein
MGVVILGGDVWSGRRLGMDLVGGVKICRMVSEAKSFGFGKTDEGKYVQLQQKRKVEKKSARATESCSDVSGWTSDGCRRLPRFGS